jgi:hypothetical protein
MIVRFRIPKPSYRAACKRECAIGTTRLFDGTAERQLALPNVASGARPHTGPFRFLFRFAEIFDNIPFPARLGDADAHRVHVRVENVAPVVG